ncbi:MAG TPA: histone deacetylase family protein [Bacteroidetes bacterium]|nr:histone deacetylase family protein [Bacteroidota bacterium]
MFVIRRIGDDIMPADRDAVLQVLDILRSHFPDVDEKKILEIPEQLKNPLKYRFRTTLLVAENRSGRVLGFALLMYASDLKFCYLDYIATRKDVIAGGIGSSLYERARNEALDLGATGLFFECLPDDPALCTDPQGLEQNRARLRFYERFGAFPLLNTRYETPVNPSDSCAPYLVCDFLGKEGTMSSDRACRIIRALLERKYPDYCPEEYIREVVNSVTDDPVVLRPPRYIRKKEPIPSVPGAPVIRMIVNDRHAIHHVHERGYVESPVRIASIYRELMASGCFREVPAERFSERHILEVHDAGYVKYFKRICEQLPAGKSVYPYVFPIRNAARPPADDSVRAGYYCMDTFTPLNKNAYLAARRAVDCALTGAVHILGGEKAVYALVRPPGHHAERKVFGGFCYFNSGAVAAHYLSRYGRVAMLDIDYHHGNGQQDIFYARPDVLTVSIHGHPSFAYPYFSGYADERGEGSAVGTNINFPLKETTGGEEYRNILAKALRRIRLFKPSFLVVLLGLDTAQGDPTGTWSLRAGDFQKNGEMIGSMRIPLLLVQEGGYKNRILGQNARAFFNGLMNTLYQKEK